MLMNFGGSYDAYINNFQGTFLAEWMLDHPSVPYIAGVMYLILVLYVPKSIMASQPPLNLRAANIVWNLFLTLFSMCGAYYTVPYLVKAFMNPEIVMAASGIKLDANTSPIITHSGFYTTTCALADSFYFNGDVGFWVALFALSKIPEMIDTAFLVFQKKPVIFLHWYHHLTVMLFCWFAYVQKISSGLWFASMNYSVHSIMYLYYFVCACGHRRLVRPFAPIITFVQIFQMVVGTIVVCYTYTVKHVLGRSCTVTDFSLHTGLVMYVSYLLLFSQLFYRSYLSPRDKASIPHVAAEMKKKE
ncbi:fatty acid elongase [Trypanosoma brucei equiperdum]|uniref:Elongation of fatty acids protein n=1 Tax=Trypanosoma brucei equiperdum TaxID=630700 RepID=A0A3L6L405_9TRYP|nr:fatty acid elongase [Trypanosoma brucei equiperdum]